MDEKVIKRDIVDNIMSYINDSNIIVLHGARQVGKTHILYYIKNLLYQENKLTYYIDLEDSRFVDLLNQGVEDFILFLQNEGFEIEQMIDNNSKLYVFIDEIQYLDDPSKFLKLIVDHHRYIKLIVSGSSSFNIKSKFSDSLVGRTINFDIFNLSFNEFLRFKKINYNLDKLSDIHLERVIKLYKEYVLYGGYPQIVLEDSIEKKERYLQQIIDTYVKKDIKDLANIKDIRKFNNVLKILSQQTGNLLNVNTLSINCGISKETIEKYLFILENTYIIKLVPPFSTNVKIEVIKAPKIFFYDTGLLQLLWLKTLQKTILGNIFETSIFSELVKKYGFENINYWRTKNQEEIDFILTKKDKIIPIEVKMGFNLSKRSYLQSFINKYNTEEYKVVGINKIKEIKNFIYPWNL